MSDSVDAAIAETRQRRLALHALVAQIRRDREAWTRMLNELPLHRRLTRDQRQLVRRWLREHGLLNT